MTSSDAQVPLATLGRFPSFHPRRSPRMRSLYGSVAFAGIVLLGAVLLPTVAASGPAYGPAPPTTPMVVTIYANGTVNPATAPIARTGNDYTLTGDLSGSVVLERNDSTLSGAGFSIDYAGEGSGYALTVQAATNVTISGLAFTQAPNGTIAVDSSSGVTIEGNDLATSSPTTEGIYATSSAGLTIRSNTLGNATISVVRLLFVSGANISGNTFSPGTGYSFYAGDSDGFSFFDNSAARTDGMYLIMDANFSVVDNDLSDSEVGDSGQGVISYRDQGGVIDGNDFTNDTYPLISTFDQNMTVEANNFTASAGFTMYSVNFQNDANVTFSGNVVTNLQQVYLLRSSNVDVLANTIRDNWGSGIYVDASTTTQVSNNTFSADSYAIEELDGATGLYFSGNIFQTPAVGIAVYSSNASLLTITHNELGPTTGAAIQLVSSSYLDIDSNSLSGDTGGVELMNDGSALLSNNSFASSGPVQITGQTGVLSVTENAFTGGTNLSVAAAPGFGPNFLVAHNSFISGTSSLSISGWEGGAVLSNSVEQWVGTAGLLVQASNGTTLESNTVEGSTSTAPALSLVGSDGLAITANEFDGAAVGIALSASSANVLTENVVQDDLAAYALSSGSVGNAIYHNNFIADGLGTIDPSSAANAWNLTYPIAGNYWSVDVAPDLFRGPGQNVPGPDGVVDVPLPLAIGVADDYPLTVPWAPWNITFVESGLPAGAGWSVAVNGTTATGNTSTIEVPTTNGAYAEYVYNVTGPTGYYATPGTGAVWVNQSSASVTIDFSNTGYAASFTETGLAPGTSWSVAMDGRTASSTTSTVTILVPNGTYAFTIGGVPGYAASPPTGDVTVAGAPVTVPIAFRPAGTYELSFVVTSGLAPGASWSVTVAGQTLSGATPSLSLFLANGTYPFEIGPPAGSVAAPPSGSATIAGAPASVEIRFSAGNVTLTFEATGLPAGTEWRASVSGASGTTNMSGAGSALVFALPPGTYAYRISAQGYAPSPPSGTVQLTTDESVPVAFQPFAYTVTFVAQGLPSGASWNVTIDDRTVSGNGPVIEFALPNATYLYTVGSTDGAPHPSNGTVVVDGSGASITIQFPSSSPPNLWPLAIFLIASAVAAFLILVLLGILFGGASRRRRQSPPPPSRPSPGSNPPREWQQP